MRWFNGWPGGTWDQAIFSYVKNAAVFRCPSNPKQRPGAVVLSYALPRNVSGAPLAAIPNPAATVVLYDKGGEALGIREDSTGEYFYQTVGLADRSLWHPEGKRFAFADGHVRFWKVGLGPWAYDFRPPEGDNEFGAGYCGSWYNTTDDADGGPGKNLPP